MAALRASSTPSAPPCFLCAAASTCHTSPHDHSWGSAYVRRWVQQSRQYEPSKETRHSPQMQPDARDNSKQVLGQTNQTQGNIPSVLLEIVDKASVEPTACKYTDKAHTQTGCQRQAPCSNRLSAAARLSSLGCSLVLRIGLSKAAEFLDVAIRQHVQTFGISLRRHKPQHVNGPNCSSISTLMHFYTAITP